MNYIDCFLIPVPTSDKEMYRAHEAKWWPTFKKHGAQSLVIGWGDDVPTGKQTDFLRAVHLKKEETVVFCWMTWPDKETRNKAFAAIETDMSEEMDMPFDGTRMDFDGTRIVMGGFIPIIQEG